ncbi:MAG: 30S ribosomal protein S6 [Verrucomicrobiae bacterium]|nr:30S ribosomal protein S6 [Verrucomicrobiae bacterium]
MKKYEGLFILNVPNKEEEIKEAIDNIAKEIVALGGKVETVQKLDRHTFARAKNKKTTSGYYVNLIFTCAPSVIEQLRAKFALKEEIFRVMFSVAPQKTAQQTKPAETVA